MKKLIIIGLVAMVLINAHVAHAGDNLDWMYFLDQSNDVLWTANLDGSERTSLLTLNSNPRDIDVDPGAGKIYWTQSDKVVRADLDGANLEVLWEQGSIGLKGIGVDGAGEKLYFLEQSNDVLWSANLDGSGRTSLLTLDSNPWDIDVDIGAGKIYWTQSDKVLRSDLDGANLEVLWEPGSIGLKGIGVDGAGEKLYFLDQLNDVLWSANLDGSGRTSLLTLDSNPWDIDVDIGARKLYWTQSDKVMRANLDGTNLEVLWEPGLIALNRAKN